MKLYGDYEFSSISMIQDAALILALDEALSNLKIDVVIESGTFLGLGSTKTLADYFSTRMLPKRFVTIEVNWSYWQQAKRNLKRYGFIECKWGASVDRKKALEFLQRDPALKNHQDYPEIFIDDIENPIGFYSSEIMGTMREQTSQPIGGQSNFDLFWEGENLLARLLYMHRLHTPLIVLDSAGGVGYLEFQNTINIMGDQSYILLLDDTHHVKHFRSLQFIKNSAAFKIIGSSAKHGWVVALHAA